MQPLLVRKHGNGYEIIAGERRYQASKLAGLEELPVIIKDVNDEEMLALALIENLQRSDLNPVEEAKGYRYDPGGVVEGRKQVTLCNYKLAAPSRSPRSSSADDF